MFVKQQSYINTTEVFYRVMRALFHQLMCCGYKVVRVATTFTRLVAVIASWLTRDFTVQLFGPSLSSLLCRICVATLVAQLLTSSSIILKYILTEEQFSKQDIFSNLRFYSCTLNLSTNLCLEKLCYLLFFQISLGLIYFFNQASITQIN